MQTLRVTATLLFFGLGILAYSLWGRSGRQVLVSEQITSAQAHLEAPAALPVIKEIHLEYHQPDMPPGPGHESFATQCVVCHSPRYVLNQPLLPRKTWAAEVTKMVNAYGAPIPADQQKDIVNYLVFWHGQEDGAFSQAPGPHTAAKRNE